jgi:citrate lyase alpha subunit
MPGIVTMTAPGARLSLVLSPPTRGRLVVLLDVVRVVVGVVWT